MKKLLLASISLVIAIAVPMPMTAGADIIAGSALPSPFVFEAPPAVKVMPAGAVYVVADVKADTPQAGSTGRDEKRQDESIEKKKPSESKGKAKLKINMWPLPDNMKSSFEKKEDEKHLPPDRF